jgi:transposase
MSHLHRKIKKGRPYYYIREIKRVDGKPKVVSQIYLGSPEAIAKRFAESAAERKPQRIANREFGSLFLAREIEKRLDTIGLIDGLVPRAARETGPSIGEYFFYAWANRLINPRSKRALPDWYRGTAVSEIRPVPIEELSSQRYWEKWDRVSPEAVEAIGKEFFARLWSMQPAPPECLLFDTTNYYTYMSSPTESDLCARGHNKDGKHHLRQVGLALLVDRDTELPLFYRVYEGNTHDSVVFRRIIDEMFGVMCGFNTTKQRLTVVFDKGMNSPEAIHTIDDHGRVHFITTYSPHFVEELAGTELRHFAPVEEPGKRKEGDELLAYRTKMALWDRERTLVVTYNPKTARKKRYTLEQKLEFLRATLLEYRRAYREKQPHWRNPEAIRERYLRECERLHVGAQYYRIDFTDGDSPEMSFRKDPYQVGKSEALFGRNVIVTDNHDWTTEEIVKHSLDRYRIEKQFRASKSAAHVDVNPFYHWTDGKIRCQLLCCVISLVALRLIERTVNANRGGDPISGRTILDRMRRLHSALLWYPGKREAERVLETPDKTQSEVLSAFGYRITEGGVLQEA